VIGVDISQEAVDFARSRYLAPNTVFLRASATRLPFGNGAFDLITAFEVIEHLDDWKALLSEARRVLAATGVFLVSTPNKLYYAESREQDGPNPFHAHEFEFEEFRAALEEVFPCVQILMQNRLESVGFYPQTPLPLDARIDRPEDSPADANFFLGVCTLGQPALTRSFLYVPRAANVLREREHHIKLLEKDLRHSIAEHHALAEKHTALTGHLEEQNRWAAELAQTLKDAQQRIVELQQEFQDEQERNAAIADAYKKTVADLEIENQKKTDWAIETERRLTAELVQQSARFTELLQKLDSAEQTVVDRTRWAQQLDEQRRQLETKLEMIARSRWVRLGRTIGVGPKVTDS
jgi:SAM-dependent methyltransferase